jgi:hypothetical protein
MDADYLLGQQNSSPIMPAIELRRRYIQLIVRVG